MTKHEELMARLVEAKHWPGPLFGMIDTEGYIVDVCNTSSAQYNDGPPYRRRSVGKWNFAPNFEDEATYVLTMRCLAKLYKGASAKCLFTKVWAPDGTVEGVLHVRDENDELLVRKVCNGLDALFWREELIVRAFEDADA